MRDLRVIAFIDDWKKCPISWPGVVDFTLGAFWVYWAPKEWPYFAPRRSAFFQDELRRTQSGLFYLGMGTAQKVTHASSLSSLHQRQWWTHTILSLWTVIYKKNTLLHSAWFETYNLQIETPHLFKDVSRSLVSKHTDFEIILLTVKQWFNRTPQIIVLSFDALRRRCQACINANDGHTRYWVLWTDFWHHISSRDVSRSLVSKHTDFEIILLTVKQWFNRTPTNHCIIFFS